MPGWASKDGEAFFPWLTPPGGIASVRAPS